MVTSYSIKDKYCGNDNCYELLGLKRNASIGQIRKAFRELSVLHHPDKVHDRDNTQYYRQIVQAYDVLLNEETRIAYLDYLDNPNRGEFQHYYNYYNHVYHPQSNPIIVVSTAIIVLSLIQYVIRIGMYNNAIKSVMHTTHFKNTINQRYQQHLETNGNVDKDDILKETLKEVTISGAWAKPTLSDIWIVAFILFIYRIFIYWPYFTLKWKYYYEGRNITVSPGDAAYKTQLILNIGYTQWNCITNKDELIERQLWIKDNLDQYNLEQADKHEEYKQKHQAKYKQMKRYMKKQQ